MRRPGFPSQNQRMFPVARVSRVPLRVGLTYGMTIQDRPIPTPDVPMPIRSSLAQVISVHRFQLSRNLRLLRTYGFAPGNPVLNSVSQRLTSNVKRARPLPTIYGTSGRGAALNGPIGVTPGSTSPGTMGAPKRFPKALPITPNTYRPPIY